MVVVRGDRSATDAGRNDARGWGKHQVPAWPRR